MRFLNDRLFANGFFVALKSIILLYYDISFYIIYILSIIVHSVMLYIIIIYIIALYLLYSVFNLEAQYRREAILWSNEDLTKIILN